MVRPSAQQAGNSQDHLRVIRSSQSRLFYLLFDLGRVVFPVVIGSRQMGDRGRIVFFQHRLNCLIRVRGSIQPAAADVGASAMGLDQIGLALDGFGESALGSREIAVGREALSFQVAQRAVVRMSSHQIIDVLAAFDESTEQHGQGNVAPPHVIAVWTIAQHLLQLVKRPLAILPAPSRLFQEQCQARTSFQMVGAHREIAQ